MVWRAEDPQGYEADKIKYLAVPYTRGKGIDLGCGPKKAFEHFIGVDNCIDTQLFNIPMNPDVKVEDCMNLPFENASLDFVFSSHMLEHVQDCGRALDEIWRVLKPGGHLVLYLPHADLYPNIGEPWANPDHKHDFRNADIRRKVSAICYATRTGFNLLIDEVRAEGTEYSFFQVYRKLEARVQLEAARRPRPAKTACVVRYGGFGDQIQASNILPALKREGYHVTFMTTPKGQDVLLHDPHIDDWLIQDNNQVPNHELTAYWKQWAGRFDRFINLSESVEATLLAMPGRANHQWPESVRRKYLGVNYLEFTAELAQVPYASEARFYPTEKEREWAREYLAGLPGTRRIMYALAGSSVHKFYPWQDAVIARVMTDMPDTAVIMAGDEACRLLEQGWENESRVRRTSGALSIRDTLTLATMVDLVIGPETGVLNAVAFDPAVAKVVMLSHSSPENLTKHWVNAATMLPDPLIDCYPCHRLHYGSEWCRVHEDSGAAMCAASIDPGDVFAAVQRLMEKNCEARQAA